jgi:cell division initiation protein
MIDHTKLNNLRGHEFSKAIRGYATKEVDEFVESLLFETQQLVEAYQELDRRVSEIGADRDEIRKREEVLSSTLVAAQSTAEEWKSLARKESDQLIREAHGTVDEMIRKANQEAEELLRQAREKWRMEEEERARARHELGLRIGRVRGEFLSMKESLDRWAKLSQEIAGPEDDQEKSSP